jgi:GDPmannose 4,6-dehydratase
LVQKYRPDEFYNAAAQSFVGASWDQPLTTCQINFDGVCNCLETIRLTSPDTKFFQFSTSEVYGDVTTEKQNEETPARPRSPYGASKYGAESLVKVYRDSYDLFACYARCFNYESQRRGKQFVTRKITSAIAEMWHIVDENIATLVSNGAFLSNQHAFDLCLERELIKPIALGNLDAQRDWSDCRDIIYGVWLIMQQDEPKDYVLASGQTHSIKEFLETAFGFMEIYDWEKFVTIDPKFYRPADVNYLCGDASKAKKELVGNHKFLLNQWLKR